MEEAFQEIRKNEVLRQPYLDKAIALCPESVSKIIYDPNLYEVGSYVNQLIGEGALEKTILEKAQPDPSHTQFVVVPSMFLIGRGEKHPIFVTGMAFQKYGIEELFLNSLVEHEGRHCSDIMHGLTLRNGAFINQENVCLLQNQTFIKMLEIRGYYNAVVQAQKKGITHRLYLEELRFRFDWEEWDLREINPISELETMIISDPRNIYSHL